MFYFWPGACCSGIVITALLLFGSIILRYAISLANKCLGTPLGGYYPEDEELDEWIGYRQLKRPVKAIPRPGIWKGMLCAFLLAVFGFIPGIPMSYVFDFGYRRHDYEVTAHLCGLVVTFPISALVLAGMLPTRYGRACLVLLMSYLIILALFAGIWVVLYILAGLF